jgi:hypothetical protein
MRDLDEWNHQVLKHLPKLINRLAEILESWDIFERQGLGYFTEELRQQYLKNIRDLFIECERCLRKLEKLETSAKTRSKDVSFPVLK